MNKSPEHGSGLSNMKKGIRFDPIGIENLSNEKNILRMVVLAREG